MLITQGHRQLKEPFEALSACQEGRNRFPEDAELLYEEALLLREKGDLGAAATCLTLLMNIQSAPYFASVDAGLKSHRARLLLGTVYREQGKLKEAESQWRVAVQEAPDFGPAWFHLGELYIGEKRWNEIDTVIKALRNSQSPTDADVILARSYFARKDFTAARQVLEKTIAKEPNVSGPLVILSHVLLEEGRDLETAEEVLRRILKLDPKNQEAKHNLSVLLKQLGKIPLHN